MLESPSRDIPAKAGIQKVKLYIAWVPDITWVPACAGIRLDCRLEAVPKIHFILSERFQAGAGRSRKPLFLKGFSNWMESLGWVANTPIGQFRDSLLAGTSLDSCVRRNNTSALPRLRLHLEPASPAGGEAGCFIRLKCYPKTTLPLRHKLY